LRPAVYSSDMEVEGVLGLLVLAVVLAAGAVWLFKTVAKRHEKHLLLIAQVAHELALRQTQAAEDSVRFEGVVNGVPIQLRTYAVAGARSTNLITEVQGTLPGRAPKGLCIRRMGIRQRLVASIDGNEGDGQQLLSDPSVAEACMQLTESLWSGMAGTGEVDDGGIRLTKGGSISDAAIIREMVQRVVVTAQILDTAHR
jgi:hypothetical protein